nr:retrovirus-related Pol polyprotein from transposon TNT 1-94 [Tanacetum cinerariifolium]
MKPSTTNVETSINEEEVFHEVPESFQGESSLSSLNDDVQQSPKEVILPQTNTHSISNNMVPNVDEASTSHNVFNERLEDAYFDASTSFHDPSNTAFLNGNLKEEVYVGQPPGFVSTQYPDYVYALDKALYGLKQAHRACDSKSAIAISCNPVQHTRTKHIDVRYHFIKDHVEKGTIELYFVGTEYQLVDLFTKSLPEARFKFLVEKLGMMSRET